MAKNTTHRKTAAASTHDPAVPVAAYTMYGGTAVRPAVRKWWGGVAQRLNDLGLTDVPKKPTWALGELEQWHAPNLLLAQTCGYPLMSGVTGPARLVCTPSYDVPFTNGPNYVSLIVVPVDDPATGLAEFRGRRAAMNKPTSHSGCNAFRRLVADYLVQWESEMGGDIPTLAGGRQFFGQVLETGNHLNSLKAVAKGKADIAAIDCVSYHFIKAADPALVSAVRILTTTAEAPGLPLITAHWRSDEEVDALRRAVMETLNDARLKDALDEMRISGFQVMDRSRYHRTLEMQREAEDRHYPVLA